MNTFGVATDRVATPKTFMAREFVPLGGLREPTHKMGKGLVTSGRAGQPPSALSRKR